MGVYGKILHLLSNLKFGLRVCLKHWNDRGEFELDWAKVKIISLKTRLHQDMKRTKVLFGRQHLRTSEQNNFPDNLKKNIIMLLTLFYFFNFCLKYCDSYNVTEMYDKDWTCKSISKLTMELIQSNFAISYEWKCDESLLYTFTLTWLLNAKLC